MKNQWKILLCLGVFLGVSSCYYDKDFEIEIPDIPDNQEVLFRTDIEPLFSRSGKDCTQCHNESADLNLTIGNAYNSIVQGGYVDAGNAEGSLLFQRAPGQNHPLDVGFILDVNDLALIKEWIYRGALNN